MMITDEYTLYYDPKLLFFKKDINSLSEECFMEILQQKYIFMKILWRILILQYVY